MFKHGGLLACGMALLGSATGAAAQGTTTGSSGQVSIYGLVDAYVGSMRRSGAQRTSAVNSGGMNTSFWGLRGQEDLGGGLQAFFTLESFFQVDAGSAGRNSTDPYFSRNALVGLRHADYGALSLGRQTNPLYAVTSAFNPFGGSLQLSPLMLQTWSPNYNRQVLGDSVWDNAVQYASPRWGGLRGQLVYALGEQAGNSGARNLGLTLQYNQGPWAAALSAQKVRVGPGLTATVDRQSTVMAGLSYDFGVVQVYGSAYRARTPALQSRLDSSQLGVAVPWQGGKWLASVAHARVNDGALRPGRTTAAVGYDYPLSRRTDVYAVVLRDRLPGANGATSVAGGVRHLF